MKRFATNIQYIPRNVHTVFALLCFVVVIHWLIFPYPSGLLHWHGGNLTIAPVPAKQPWWIWINTSCEFIMNDCITTTKQSTTKPCAYFLEYTVESNAAITCPTQYDITDSTVVNEVDNKSNLYSQQTSHNLPSLTSYRVSIAMKLEMKLTALKRHITIYLTLRK